MAGAVITGKRLYCCSLQRHLPLVFSELFIEGQKDMSMLTSSVGRKIIMAVTGVILILFITGHVLGNMSLYAGPDGINAYAVHLRSLGPVLWLIRLFMLAIFVVHIWLGVSLTLENRAARPISYNQKENLRTGFPRKR